MQNAYRLLPSVEEVLARADVAALGARVPRELLVRFVQAELDLLRARIRAADLDADGTRAAAEALGAAVGARVRREQASGVVRALNATGVVLHTGLGRAPVHPEAARAMAPPRPATACSRSIGSRTSAASATRGSRSSCAG